MTPIRALLIDQLATYFDHMNQMNPCPGWTNDRTVYEQLSNIEIVKWLGLIARCKVEYMTLVRPIMEEHYKNKRGASQP